MLTPVSEAESDRRLRPVMDALYSHHSRQALKLVQQAINKRPGWPAARALRACVFLQAERYSDAEYEMERLQEDLDAGRVPINEDAATKMVIYYQERRQEVSAAQIYEKAWKADITNFKLAEIAFSLYINAYTFSDAQRIATKLHRLASSKPQKYVLWASAALWLSLTYKRSDTEDEVQNTDTRMLTLVCAMITKALGTSSTPTAEATRFATRVYKEAGQFQNAFDLISNRRLVMDEAEVLHIRANVPVSNDSQRQDYCKLLTTCDSDDWGHWMKYLECVLSNPDGISEASLFVKESLDAEREGKTLKRGPLLAQLELLYRELNFEDLAAAIIYYFSVFGRKTVCAHDLRPYLYFLRGTAHMATTLDGISKIVDEKGFPYHLTESWLRLWFGVMRETPELLVQKYTTNLSNNLEPTDRQPGDDYLLIAVHLLLPALPPSPSSTDLSCQPECRYANSFAVLQSIIILETGLTRSPFNFHFKLLLILLYSEIGGMERVVEIWESLEVKHVQLATLVHLVLRPLFETGHHKPLRAVLENIENLWRECDKEIPACVSKAFQTGSINSAVEFVLFRVRLQQSAILAESVVTETQLALVTTEGEPIGVHQAYQRLTMQPRFDAKLLPNKRIFNSDDSQCLQFWNINEYDPESRLLDNNNEAYEGGVHCTPLRKAAIVADIRSLEAILHLSKANNLPNEDATRTESNDEKRFEETMILALEEEGRALPLSSTRLRLLSDIQNVKLLLLKIAEHNNSSEVEEENSILPETILRRSKANVDKIIKQVEAAIGDTSITKSRGVLSPGQLRRCCKIAFDILMIASVAISSFSPILVRGRRRIKKSGAKAGGVKVTVSSQEFECARQAILSYRDGILSACSRIQEWITCSLEQGQDWVGFLISEDQNEGDFVPYLPTTVEAVDLRDNGRKMGMVKLTQFCSEILGKTRSSHSTTCAHLLQVLACITRRLNLADL